MLGSSHSTSFNPTTTLLKKRLTGGFMLLELILALTLFSAGVLGIARSLQLGLQVSAIIEKEYEVRLSLRSFLEEIRRKPLAEMATHYQDERLQLTLQSEVQPLNIRDKNGSVLNHLYQLKVSTQYQAGAELREESIEIYLYSPPAS